MLLLMYVLSPLYLVPATHHDHLKMNLIYLAIGSERIPILPPPSFTHHVEGREVIFFRQIFDIDALSESLQWPILDWSEVKAPDSKQWDTLGCWYGWCENPYTHLCSY